MDVPLIASTVAFRNTQRPLQNQSALILVDFWDVEVPEGSWLTRQNLSCRRAIENSN